MANVDKLVLDKTDLDLNTSSVLPQGSSTQGVTDGSLGDASQADLAQDKGYVAADKFDPDHPDYERNAPQDTAEFRITPQPADGGFLGRAAGFER